MRFSYSYRSTIFSNFSIFVLIILDKRCCYGHNCQSTIEDTLHKVDCTNQYLHDIPQDLDTNAEFLDFSENNINKINTYDLEKYVSVLIFKGWNFAKGTIDIAENAFMKMPELEEIHIGNSRFEHGSRLLHFPPKLKRLTFYNVSLKDINLKENSELEALNLSTNEVTYFPELHPRAPLIFIDLNYNHLTTVSIDHIAPYCQLVYLGIQMREFVQYILIENYCECKKLDKWIFETGMNGADCLNCQYKRTPRAQSKDCGNLTLDPKFKKMRNDCIKRIPKQSNFWIWVLIAALSFFTFMSFLTAYLIKRSTKEVPQEKPLEPKVEEEGENVEDENSLSEKMKISSPTITAFVEMETIKAEKGTEIKVEPIMKKTTTTRPTRPTMKTTPKSTIEIKRGWKIKGGSP